MLSYHSRSNSRAAAAGSRSTTSFCGRVRTHRLVSSPTTTIASLSTTSSTGYIFSSRTRSSTCYSKRQRWGCASQFFPKGARKRRAFFSSPAWLAARGYLRTAAIGAAGWLGEGKEIENMLYYATPTGSEGSSGTGSKEEPTNLGISLAQTGE
ncbi:hypothetical protein GOBAR_AA23792 [Gossypium barbadense]|uniref:Uncharacterized protein n=1 Tax=Gossypium barbadense TaxID=3634 RepID=A0A2P5X0L4_GOSBA|nr:hypothetical protein GOBAR_AA23792 [Gossypium barbadense]